ncbi:THAP domain-containing protein 7 isoform X2 [Hemiscyllium ocellatum]|uniref:THAP domain-containing protein 7 isoform X2 n=1 Tax=Hemiscyllium ocellatum TaxID=170820 RepID=UPI002965D76E|nr:THAP domain-containing protein 7 isoform X2 [Hemiscyllium ocellatum]
MGDGRKGQGSNGQGWKEAGRAGVRAMPRHCSAEGCTSRDTKESRINGVTFHRLPKKGRFPRESWLLNCCRKNPDGTVPWDPPSQFIYFCSKHFEKHCFELVGLSRYHRLRDDAVPTLFQSCPQSKVALSRGYREKTVSVQTNECLTDGGGSSPAPDLRNADTSSGMSFSISQDGSSIILGYSDPQDRVNETFCLYETSSPDIPISTSQPEPEDTAPTVIYLIEVNPQSVELEAAGNTEEASKDISLPLPQPVLLNEHSPDCQVELDDDRDPVPIALYMARIPNPPPKPGAYIPVEHSYTVGCPLVWKMKLEALKVAFEKVTKELRASRKRESRLRARITSILRPQHQVLQDECTESDITEGCQPQFEVYEVEVVDEAVNL